jgi:hypothetical protein
MPLSCFQPLETFLYKEYKILDIIAKKRQVPGTCQILVCERFVDNRIMRRQVQFKPNILQMWQIVLLK